jgi:hypothetical protein
VELPSLEGAVKQESCAFRRGRFNIAEVIEQSADGIEQKYTTFQKALQNKLDLFISKRSSF